MKKFHLIAVAAAMLVFTYGTSASAGSAWLPAPGGGSVNVSYVFQTANKYYRVMKRPTPQGKDLIQNTVWVNGTYGLTDSVALDMRAGFARSGFIVAEGVPSKKRNEQGLTDFNAGVTWRVLDEAMYSGPSIAFRVGGIIRGSYDTGSINSIGDGGSGVEMSAIMGRFLTDAFALSGEVGYRYRSDDIPQDVFVNVSGGFILANRVAAVVGYEMVNATSGLDIGTPPFSPDRFPEVQEDIHLLRGGLNFAVINNLSLGASYGRVIDGRNTAQNNIFTVSVGYSF